MRTALVLGLLAVLAVSGAGYCLLAQKLDAANAEIARLRQSVDKIGNDYASARKVDGVLSDLRSQINALRAGNPTAVAATTQVMGGDHQVELFVSPKGTKALALRYAGPSFRAALEGRNLAGPSAALVQAVKVDPQNPRLGTVAFSGMKGASPGIGNSADRLYLLAVVRPDAQSVDWDLTADAREVLKQELGSR